MPACRLACLLFAAVLVAGLPGDAAAQLLNQDDSELQLDNLFGGRPEPSAPASRPPAPTQPRPTFGAPTPADEPAKEAAGESSAEELEAPEPRAKRVTVAQPVATYDTRTGTWLPDASDQASGWLPELEVPSNLIDCTCDGQLPGPRCRVWRSFVKPSDPSLNPRCVVCVKEPYLDYETVEEELHVVLQRCFETSEPFKHKGCEGGHWYEAKGTTKLRKLHSCEAKAPVKYLKPVVRYRDVYYYIQCGDE